MCTKYILQFHATHTPIMHLKCCNKCGAFMCTWKSSTPPHSRRPSCGTYTSVCTCSVPGRFCVEWFWRTFSTRVTWDKPMVRFGDEIYLKWRWNFFRSSHFHMTFFGKHAWLMTSIKVLFNRSRGFINVIGYTCVDLLSVSNWHLWKNKNVSVQ